MHQEIVEEAPADQPIADSEVKIDAGKEKPPVGPMHSIDWYRKFRILFADGAAHGEGVFSCLKRWICRHFPECFNLLRLASSLSSSES